MARVVNSLANAFFCRMQRMSNTLQFQTSIQCPGKRLDSIIQGQLENWPGQVHLTSINNSSEWSLKRGNDMFMVLSLFFLISMQQYSYI
jgi:hypothetical protein